MDLEKFKVFLKQKFIIINYPSGCFGGFLGSVLQLSDDVVEPNAVEHVFDETGASHKNTMRSFTKFHNLNDLNAWVNLNYQDKLKYLYDNCLVKTIKDKRYIVLLMCCPNYNLDLIDFFDEDKIITIKPNTNHYDILENLIFFKVIGTETTNSFLEKFSKLKNYKSIIIEKHKQEVKRIIAKQSVKFFIDDVNYNQKHLYNFELFFDETTFIQMLQAVQKQLSIAIDYSKSINLYREFKKANEKYIEPYLATKLHV
jgi:hypothetical protein